MFYLNHAFSKWERCCAAQCERVFIACSARWHTLVPPCTGMLHAGSITCMLSTCNKHVLGVIQLADGYTRDSCNKPNGLATAWTRNIWSESMAFKHTHRTRHRLWLVNHRFPLQILSLAVKVSGCGFNNGNSRAFLIVFLSGTVLGYLASNSDEHLLFIKNN